MVSPGGFWDGFARWVLRWFNDVGFVMVSQGGFFDGVTGWVFYGLTRWFSGRIDVIISGKEMYSR